MKLICQDDYDKLRSIVFSNNDLALRLRAQIVVLHEKNFKTRSIENIVEKTRDEIEELLQYVEFFGLNNYFDFSIDKIRKLNIDEHFKREKQKLNWKKRGYLYYLFLPFSSIFYSIINYKSILYAFLAWIIASFRGSFSNYKFHGKSSNVATFEKGASNNYLLQINKLVINEKEDTKVEVSDKFIGKTEGELENKIKEIIRSELDVTFRDRTIDKLVEQSRQRDINGNMDELRIGFYASLIVAYLIYSSSFKGGVWTLSVLGLTIAVAINSYNTESIPYVSPVPVVKVDSLQPHLPVEKDRQNIDSIRYKIYRNELVEIFDYEAYYKLIEEFYEIDHSCNALSAVGTIQKKFIYEYDRIDHSSRDYYIDIPDNRYYVHVVAYEDIRQAAFQMHHLNTSPQFNARILKVNTNSTVLYAVVISDFRGDEVKDMCEAVDTWETFCFTDNVEVGCYYNG